MRKLFAGLMIALGVVTVAGCQTIRNTTTALIDQYCAAADPLVRAYLRSQLVDNRIVIACPLPGMSIPPAE